MIIKHECTISDEIISEEDPLAIASIESVGIQRGEDFYIIHGGITDLYRVISWGGIITEEPLHAD